MNNKECVIGIPKNQRLKDDVQPILTRALELENCNYGVWRSPVVENAMFVEIKICDLIKTLRDRFIDLALISDDKGLEEEAEARNYLQNLREMDEKGEKLKDERIERCFGIRIDNPGVMRLLAREEDKEKMKDRIYGEQYKRPVYCGEKAVTSYPELLRYYMRRKVGKSVYNVQQVSGQVESYMRNGVLPNTVLAYEMVRSGDTAKQFGLISVDDEEKAYRAYPSFWRKSKLLTYQEENIERILPVIRSRISNEVNIDVEPQENL